LGLDPGNTSSGDDVRSNDMTSLLGGIANLQSVKAISPPIFAYDAQQRTLQVVDSTFYFFIRNADVAEALDSLQNPLEQYVEQIQHTSAA
jgi:hypothetical protein